MLMGGSVGFLDEHEAAWTAFSRSRVQKGREFFASFLGAGR